MKTILLILFTLITLNAKERIISLSPSITEIIFALEKGDEIVATTSYSLYPKEAQKLPIVGGYETPNLEKVLSFKPTLVIGQNYNQAVLNKLKHFNIKTLSLELKSIQSIKNSINLIAKNIDSNKANKLTNAIDNAIKQAPKSKKAHSVMIVYGLHEDLSKATYIAGHNIFFEDIILACGNTNAYTQTTTAQPVLNYENIIATNPEQIIILHSHATEAHVNVKKALKNWYTLPTKAAQNGKISIVDEDYLHIPSQRVSLTIERLCKEMKFN